MSNAWQTQPSGPGTYWFWGWLTEEGPLEYPESPWLLQADVERAGITFRVGRGITGNRAVGLWLPNPPPELPTLEELRERTGGEDQ